MNIKDISFPVIGIPGKNLILPIYNLAEAFMRAGGSVKEIWVSHEIYDMLTLEITRRDEFIEDKKINPDRWTNGLITIHTVSGEIKIRRD